MYSRVVACGSSFVLALVLSLAAFGQQGTMQQQENTPAEKKREAAADAMATNQAKHEPHMAAALEHLRQAEEELEKTSNNHGPARDQAMALTKQAENKIAEGITYYNQHVTPNK
jgi:uncharacterized protein HemX